jgi:CDP-6-deoxy-D-xylo-4-hexulose-3-dehydrase
VEKVLAAINPKTRAILAVNLLGNPSELLALKKIADEKNLLLLEDNCESLGAEIIGKKTGSISFAGTHSFFFSHHICTMEGGMVTTDSLELAETMLSIRAHGWTRGLPEKNSVHDKSKNEWEDLFRFVLPGYNLRPLELSGAIGIVQLKKFPEFLAWRRKNAEKFLQLFDGRDDLRVQRESGNSSWFGFSLILQGKMRGKRSQLIELLSANGIESRPIVAGNFTLNPVLKHLETAPLRIYEHADELHSNGFFIGNHHHDVRSDLEKVFEIYEDSMRRVN